MYPIRSSHVNSSWSFPRANVSKLVILALSSLLVACGGGGAGSNSDTSSLAQDNATLADELVSSNLDSGTATAPVGDCELTVADQQMLDRINEVRAQSRFCGDNFYEATDPVVWNCTLELAAEGHSQDMGDNNFFSHTGSDGLRVGARADAVGYNWSAVGENIAAGFDSVNAAVQGWLDSPSHCRTVMNPTYDEMAHSLYITSGADFSTYWTLLMGRR